MHPATLKPNSKPNSPLLTSSPDLYKLLICSTTLFTVLSATDKLMVIKRSRAACETREDRSCMKQHNTDNHSKKTERGKHKDKMTRPLTRAQSKECPEATLIAQFAAPNLA
ncbi:hypothetical protein DUNSADRAFT_17638 [Dunaliella salina]|uniref:Encoded protein n=1 Tax=Dunaliella salina TaxID=3046 RepID=A0ABQ7GZX0_DUNSA|nr:hypothetical protein DUNSADRAFT_17638 [Dunaliella salina]|eukprot:KAF5840154.1 hypothetical protein DUNSADRAFT_17638 [Dunaliella salina]